MIKKGLVNLARDLEECDLTFRQLNLHSRIDNFDTIGKIVRRLSYDLRNRWIRKASKIECTGEEPTINDLIQFKIYKIKIYLFFLSTTKTRKVKQNKIYKCITKTFGRHD